MSTPEDIRRIDRFEKAIVEFDNLSEDEEEDEEELEAPPKEEFLENLQQFGIDGCMRYYKKRRQVIHNYCIYHDIKIPDKGRPKKKISQEVIDMVLEKRKPEGFRTGYQTLTYELNMEGKNVQERDVRRIYEENQLFIYKKDQTANMHPNKFVAKYANQLWHTDLHEIEPDEDRANEKRYIIGFIDDRSRFLIHHEIIYSKTSVKTSEALENAFQKVAHTPHCITIDNGGEFIGKDFQNILKKYKVQDHRTHPYTPEENGKIERWWKTMEGKRSPIKKLTSEYLSDLVYHYNCLWPQRMLYELLGKKSTPRDAWDNMEKWSAEKEPEIEYF